MTSPAAPLGLPPRFAIEAPIGTGGFGSVYKALDRERGVHVALKQLNRVDAGPLYRFKQEFRALADLHHPNLVRLYELFSADGIWCFTMELIEGSSFDRFVRRLEGTTASMLASTQSRTHTTQVLTDPAGPVPSPLPSSHAPPLCASPDSGGQLFDEARLRQAIAGLVSGVLALHAAGILHRDLKPSNVLVCKDGRVVILDFGLVATGVVESHHSDDGNTAGTPEYMSPEQAQAAPLSAASDFYSIGLMLYEALTGQPAFVGSAVDILTARATRPPRDPRHIRQDLPEDLCDLCMELLARDAERRPRSADLARRVGLTTDTATSPAHSGASSGVFVGRDHEMTVLHGALARTRQGRPAVVYLQGPSGIGKTALVRRFLANATSLGTALVFEGRCYERESVPYKALDEIVDSLGRHLKRLTKLEAAGLLPRDGRALLRLFPTLGQIGLFSTLPGRDPVADPHEFRRRAFGALRELFARLTDMHPIVLSIDDVQWGDADSAALLAALLAPPDPPPILLLLTYRAEGTGANDIQKTLRQVSPAGTGHDNVDLALGSLSQAEAESLARALMGNDQSLLGNAAVVARESGGSPLFVGEIARALATGQRSGDDVSLQDILGRRLAVLPAPARSVLESLACAGGPQEKDVLASVAQLDPADVMVALERLSQEHLVEVTNISGRSFVELLHDQVRVSTVAAMLPAASRSYHLRLGERLEQIPDTDPETVAQHFFAAGDDIRAVRHAESAGDRASDALAFEHAASLFERALQAAPVEDEDRLRQKLAQALALCGRGAEAAAAYLVCADSQQGLPRIELLRQAAGQLLRAGRLKEGLETVRPVLSQAGVHMPSTPRRALASVVMRRTWLKFRGLGFIERAEDQIPVDDLRRMDICWAIGTGLVGVDQVRSADFQVRHLQLALAAGEPSRISRALSYESILSALENHAGLARGAKLAKMADDLAIRHKDPRARAWPRAAAALGAWSVSDFGRCIELLDDALPLFRGDGRDNFREMVSLEIWFDLHARFLLGRLDDVALRATALVNEARARGDRYGETTARAYIVPLVWLAVDKPAEAREEAEQAIALWGHGGCQHQHWAELRAQCSVDLYEGKGARAASRIAATRKAMKASLLLRMRTPRIEHGYLEARGFIEGAWASPQPELLLKRAETSAHRLDGEKNRLASAFAAVLRAGIIACRKDVQGARVAFSHAGKTFEALQMPLHAAAARRREGELVGGEIGRVMIETAEAILSAAGVAAPERFALFLAPRARA